jgi:hypothetical protein
VPIDNKVDIGVIIGHHKALRRGVVVHSGDSHIIKSFALAQPCQSIIIEVIAKNSSTGCSIDAITCIGYMIRPRVVEAVAPVTESSLGVGGGEQREAKGKKQEEYWGGM